MASSVYISSNLTTNQLKFIKLLDDYEIDIFRFEEIESQINYKFKNLNEVLENLVAKNLLSRIEKGKFCKPNFRNEHAIGTFLVKDGAVAYWSALNLHGLTEQFSNTIFIQTTHQKKDKSVFGIPYKFIKIPTSKQTGIIKEGYGNHSFYLTDIEKTIVDCFDLPQYSGGYGELIRAFAATPLSGMKLIDYCKSVNNQAATKRMGFLAEIFEKKGMKGFINFARKQVKNTYNPLDPKGPEKGSFHSEWKLRINITKEELLDLSNKQY